MPRFPILLALLTTPLVSPASVSAQAPYQIASWSVDTGLAVPSRPLDPVTIPDSVRRKVGYQHWNGAAIGSGLGAVGGLMLALLSRASCSDCPSDPSVPVISLAGAGLGGAFGFLAGSAVPKYEWVPSPAEDASASSE